MPDCNYCGASFESEDAYLDHLHETHRDELGRIDERRVESHTSNEATSGPNAVVIVGVVLAIALVLVGLVFAFQSTGGTDDANGGVAEGQQPTDLWSVHSHGTMAMVVDGTRVDFSKNRYQMQADAFHFENGGGTQWHVHANDVTLAFALDSLGFDVTPASITYEGTTYTESTQNTTVTFSVNGQAVTPGEYVLQEGDEIRVVVEHT